VNKLGFKNLTAFIAIVEDVDAQSGRVQIRAFGFHPSYAEDPQFEGPWSTMVNGSYGHMSLMPQPSEWVFGFFLDGDDAQQPILLGSISGANSTMPAGSGDEAENEYVKPSKEALARFGQGPMHPSISGEDTEITPTFAASVDAKENISTADGTTFSEPSPVQGGDPSKVSVIGSTQTGSFVEVSGTEDNEHITLNHVSGSSIQVDPDGNVKIKSSGDQYLISSGHSREYTSGRKDLVVEGSYSINVKGGDCNIKVSGDMNFDVLNNTNFNISGKLNFNVAEGINLTGSKISMHAREDNIDIYSGGELRSYSEGNMVLTSASDQYLKGLGIDIKGSSDVVIQGAGVASLKGGSYAAIEGGLAYMKGGSTFIDGNPNFDSGAASGKAQTAALPPSKAIPIAQDDIPSRAVVSDRKGQYNTFTRPRTGRGSSSVDDVVDVSYGTTGDAGTSTTFDTTTILRNRNTGAASSLTEVIGDAESNGNYNRVYSGSVIGLPKELSTMTVDEVLAWQDESVAAGSASSAAGKYQVIRKTLRRALNGIPEITGSSLFNVETQDTICYYLLEIRGLSDYQKGNITAEDFANNLSKEWAGLPVVTGPNKGSSYYDGDGLNKANVSPTAVLNAINEINKGIIT